GAGTKEKVLNDVLLGRSNADIRAIEQEYSRIFGPKRSLKADIKGDLSARTERLFDMVLAATRAEESAPCIPQEIDRAVTELHKATEGRTGTDQITVCQILTSHSNGQLRAITQAFEHKYRVPLEKVIVKDFSGHMEDALVRILKIANDKIMLDAEELEDTMKGFGTKDYLLVERVVRVHWDRQHLDQVKRAYQFRYKRDLAGRIKGETSGDYQRLMLACIA
ncbi:MAG: hypothetical protein M1824_002821, partial [Vezdaea acicularis]